MGAAILQVVPRAPGSRDGVGDYAHTLAVCLRQTNEWQSAFAAVARADQTETAEGFQIFSPLAEISDEQLCQEPALAIVLHYVNYGYHRRGVPFLLPQRLRKLQLLRAGRLITIFHELYAAGSWEQSSFWLRPIQKRIARTIANRSALCIVSSPSMSEQLHRLAANAHIIVRPVFSNFGEPALTAEQIADRDPRRWVICGGIELIKRSLRSFLRRARDVGGRSAPRELFVVGGRDSAVLRQVLRTTGGISAHYLPEVEAAVASGILASCSYGWIDYFKHGDIPTAAILKSSGFAAYCAHGVIPVFPEAGSSIALGPDALPGPFFVAASRENLPMETERPAVAQEIYQWYGRNASSFHLAASVASAITA